MSEPKTNKTIIECECGTHLLVAQSWVEPMGTGGEFHQDINLAMFSYGNYPSVPGLWRRLVVAWNYIRTGKMHEDQLCLSPGEARKLADFLSENIVEV